jgi:hypothetical protein
MKTNIYVSINILIKSLLVFILFITPSFSFAYENNAYNYIYEIMDKFHNSFDLYTNQDEGGNHFYPSGWMGDISSLTYENNWLSDCHEESCIKIAFSAKGTNWAGLYWQEPERNWGTVPNGGYDISGATELAFWVKGKDGSEKVEFFVGGCKGTYGDSTKKISTGIRTLTNNWQQITIDLSSQKLSHIICGFGFVIESSNNPNGVTFYLDDIKYNKSRLDELRFLVSYETLPLITPDRYIRNASFIYDNALALIAFLIKGSDEDIRRAKILADAFVYAQNNDEYYKDGRLRNAYMSGDLIDHLTGYVRMSGWWDPDNNKWNTEYINTNTGNIAWVMIALLNYYKKVGGSEYLKAAENLGNWIVVNTKDEGKAGGYTGGYEGLKTENQQKIMWKSTEHNMNIYSAFMLLFEITGDKQWREEALYAKNFVESMWDGKQKRFLTGTLKDGIEKNWDPFCDIQALSLMTLDNYNSAISWEENNCYTDADGFKGFDYNTDKKGVWFEGTARMAIAYLLDKDKNKSDSYIRELQKAQSSSCNYNGKGIVDASHDGIITGITDDRATQKLYCRLHVGATAWYIFAERQYNPYSDKICTDSSGDNVDCSQMVYYCDDDADGYLSLWENGICFGEECVLPIGCQTNSGTDCDDNDASVNKVVDEGPVGSPACKDGKDNDCDGFIDKNDPDCTAPDLVIISLNNPPASKKIGKSIIVSDTVKNDGEKTAGKSTTGYYLSKDTNNSKSENDIPLKGNRPVLKLKTGKRSKGGNFKVTISKTTPPDTYYLKACADDSEKISEGDEKNNCKVSQATITVKEK